MYMMDHWGVCWWPQGSRYIYRSVCQTIYYIYIYMHGEWNSSPVWWHLLGHVGRIPPKHLLGWPQVGITIIHPNDYVRFGWVLQAPISYHEWHANAAQSPRLSEPLQLRIWSLDTSILGKIKFFSLTFHCTSTDFFIKWIRWDGKAQFGEMKKLKNCMILNGIQNKPQCRGQVCYGAWRSNSALMETSVKLWWQCLTNSVRAGTFPLQKNINWTCISPSESKWPWRM